ncbi:extracellular triacylglycerol lipase precursor [Lentinula raphanica]|uniref:Carboxylic ester hydrolase n=1 Tax=Lentinula raphanica TaxID=153919 RepID=A0AA38PAF5_9AGAR|nr:extracellular triacylglycerol lipase precursor [Lentinula raphanica]
MRYSCLLLSSIAVLADFGLSSPEINLGKTKIIGVSIPSLSQDFFGGIPYAEAPVGPLRLAPPVFKPIPDSDSAGLFNATSFGKACFQGGLVADEVSEDCLSINVFRPSDTSSRSRLPVLLWTHGSGFATSSSAMFNASVIIAQSMARGTPILFVSINYRLGPLGWPQGSVADAEGILNLGLMDQVAGLQWVQRNIEAFGGDKTKVTIGGPSAGAIMSTALFMHPYVVTLGRAGIFESGFPGTSSVFNATHRQSSWDTFVAGVTSCQDVTADSVIECLRSANASEILQGVIESTSVAQAFGPALDGPDGFFPDLPSQMLANGPIVDLPFIAGQNKDEGTNFVNPTLNYTTTLVGLGLQEQFAPPTLPQTTVNELLDLYPDVPALGCPFETGNETFGLSPGYKEAAALATDIDFSSQRRFWMETAAKVDITAYGYYFIQQTSSTAPQLGVTHGDQVPYTFGNLISVNESDAAAIFLSEVMIDYFVSFVNSLYPNDGLGVSRPQWPSYKSDGQFLMQLNGTNLTTLPDDFRKDGISYITSQMSAFHQ